MTIARPALIGLLTCALLTGCKDDDDKKTTVGKAVGEAVAAAVSKTYRVRATSDGPGWVALSPRRSSYSFGDRVTVTAHPRTGAEFAGWGGDLSGSIRTQTLTVRGELEVTASFELPQEEQRVREAIEGLLVAAQDRRTDADALEEHIGAVANAYGDHRDALYEPVAKADEAFLRALRDCGEDAQSLANLDRLVLDEVGPWAYLAGRTASLRMLYERDPGLPRCDPAAFDRAYQRWLRAVERAARKLEDADRVPSHALAPRMSGSDLSSSWRATYHRREAFEQERRVYLTAARLTDDPALKARLEEEAQALEDVRAVDDDLLALVTGQEPPPAAPRAPSAPAPAVETTSTPEPSGLPAPAERSGAAGILSRVR